jgi:hypothetical protein
MDAVVVTGEFENFHYPDALDEYFEEWKELDPLVVEIEGVTVRTFRIFVCRGYRTPVKAQE